MRSLNSERKPPIVLPWPHIVSRTGTTVVVSVIALVRVCARRESASGRGVWFVLPGLDGMVLDLWLLIVAFEVFLGLNWKLYSVIPRASQRRRSSRNESYACFALALSFCARLTR